VLPARKAPFLSSQRTQSGFSILSATRAGSWDGFSASLASAGGANREQGRVAAQDTRAAELRGQVLSTTTWQKA